jgi:hypothetical protein
MSCFIFQDRYARHVIAEVALVLESRKNCAHKVVRFYVLPVLYEFFFFFFWYVYVKTMTSNREVRNKREAKN